MKFILLLLSIILMADAKPLEEQIIENIKAKKLMKIANDKMVIIKNNDLLKDKKEKEILEVVKEYVSPTNNVYNDEYKKDIFNKLILNISKTTIMIKKIYTTKESFFKYYMNTARLIQQNGAMYDGFRYYDTNFYLNNKKMFDIYNRLSLLLLQKYDYYLRQNIKVDNQLKTLEVLTDTISKIQYHEK